MKMIVFAACIAMAIADSPTMTNCGAADDPVVFDLASTVVSPYPVVLPGTFSVTFTVNVLRTIDLSTAVLKLSEVKRQIIGSWWVNLCDFDVGDLCDDHKACDLIPELCSNDHSVGSHTVTVSYDVSSLPSVLAAIAKGTYTAKAQVVDGTNAEIACLAVTFEAINKQ